MSQGSTPAWSIPVVAIVAAAGLAVSALALAEPSAEQPALAERAAAAAAAGEGGPGRPETKPDFPPFAEVAKDFEKVVSTADGQASLYTLYKRDKDARLLAELPRSFEQQRIFIATTFAGGVSNTGIQIGDTYTYWKRFDKRLALIEPNVAVRATGDAESRKSQDRIYTDRVLLDVPIVAMGPGGGPVVDLGQMLTQEAPKFFGGQVAGANTRLLKIAKAKAFPKNVEIAFELPARDGRLITLHYSVSLIEGSRGYKPREADPRIGYFTTSYRDISRQDRDTQWVRNINRWHLEKRDPKLSLSPPKEPIVFYIEATTPVHYRRWVRQGVLEWNKAFEKVGITGAIEVYQQDASGAHMDKDPEDVRYNFIRWTSANLGFAIGPSRVHPETGQILDADVVIDDGFVRGWFRSYQQLLPEVAMTAYGPEVLAWLERNPQWDPRVRLASPAERDSLVQHRQMESARMMQQAVREAQANPDPAQQRPLFALRSGAALSFGMLGQEGAPPSLSMYQGRCAAVMGKAMDVAMMRVGLLAMDILDADDLAQPESGGDDAADEPKDKDKDKDEKDAKEKDKDESKDKKPAKKKEPKVDMLDGLPEWFVGPLLADLVSHEVGHTLGLRHNFKASSIAEMAQINSDEFKGKKAQTGSVMDYAPINIYFKDDKPESGALQGDYTNTGLGAYDFWAIEYGYTDKDTKAVLARVADDELPYGTDEDLFGPDPLVKQFDLGKDSLDYAENTLRLVQHLRGRIIDRVVKDGQSWQRARDAYSLLLARHMGSLRIASYYLGGASVVRDRKGDPGDRAPITPFDMAQQRRALRFLVDSAFRDEAFGLDRRLLSKMTVDKWFDDGGMSTLMEDPAWPIHDRILGVQAAAITMLVNPVTLQRVYDNEFRVEPGQDALTLPEMLDTISAGIFTELDSLKSGTARQPSISSLRRNLQREYLTRLIDLTLPDAGFTAAYKPISNLVVLKLRELKAKIDSAAKNGGIDPYTKAHLAEAGIRIEKALDAGYVYNANQFGGFGGFGFSFFQPQTNAPSPQQPDTDLQR